MNVSYFNSCKMTVPNLHISIQKFVDGIRLGEWSEPVTRVRRALEICGKDSSEYKSAKLRLPAVTFSGTFSNRCESGLIEHSGIIQIDVDDVPTEQYDSLKKVLCDDPHVMFCFASPSFGLKAGVKIDPATHKDVFPQIEEYFNTKLGVKIDKSTKDIGRLCFVSYDPEVFSREDAELFRCKEIVQRSAVQRYGSPVRNSGSGFPHSLEKGSRKYQCPLCGKIELKRYVDNVTGEYVGDYFGRCNRELNCQYHVRPPFQKGEYK